ncbi:MAG: hypothetical protein ACKVQA_16730 [Burkholderiales bacterium]
MSVWRVGLILAVIPLSSMSEDIAVKLRAIPEYHGERADSPFAISNGQTALGRDQATGELELRAKPWDVNLVATGRGFKREGQDTNSKLVLNELYYDTTLAGQRAGLGKKIMSWDVGFGFRPLDVIQQEDRRAIFTTTLEGIPYVSWERFGEQDAWMMVLANPWNNQEREARDDRSIALKYYKRTEATDWHAVVRASRRYRWESGVAFSRVLGESTEVHASALYQRRYEKNINSLAGQNATILASSDPVKTRTVHDGYKALAGFTWTSAGGWSLIGEAWYDASAYTQAEWEALAALTRAQLSLQDMSGVPPGSIEGNIAWSAQAFNRPNLLRENMLIRLSHRGTSGATDPALDLLITPPDGGWVATASASYEDDRFRLDAGYRVFGGPKDSAYRLLPEDRVAYLALEISF